jgi:hypothetical protein
MKPKPPAERRKAGRPSKLDQSMLERITNLVRAGNYLETAAQACGINKETLHRWLREGARAASGQMHEFSESIHRAQAEAEARDLMVIDQAGTPHDVEEVKERWEDGKLVERTVTRRREFDWKAKAWRLERRLPMKYGRRDRLDIEATHVFSVKPAPPPMIVSDPLLLEDGDGADRD